jgi:RNA polymerase primary sigma factor
MKTIQRTDDELLQRYLRDLGTSIPLEPSAELELAHRMRQAREKLVQIMRALPTACRDQILGVFSKSELTPDLPFVRLGRLVKRLASQADAHPDGDVTRLARQAQGIWSELEEIRSTFVSCNLRLVVHVVKRFAHKGVALLDLIQEGNIGLMRAVDKFDPRRGTKFGTCAVLWIAQAVCREAPSLNRVVRIPDYQARRRQRIACAISELTQELGRKPTAPEIATRAKLTPEKIADALSHIPERVDLEEPGDGVEGLSLLELLPDTHAVAPSEKLVKQDLLDRLPELLSSVSPRQRQILRLRYGLDDEQSHTLKEIGMRLHLSKERVRQIEAEAMQVLRSLLSRLQPGKFGHRPGRDKKSGAATAPRVAMAPR